MNWTTCQSLVITLVTICIQSSGPAAVASNTFNDSTFNLACAHICPSLNMVGSCCKYRTVSSAFFNDSSRAPWKLLFRSWALRRPNSAKPAWSSKCSEPRQRDSAVKMELNVNLLIAKIHSVLRIGLPAAMAENSLSNCWHNSIFKFSFSSDMFWIDVGPPTPRSWAKTNFTSDM